MFEHDFERYPELRNSEMADLEFVSPHPQITEDFDAKVVKVHDGDTITVTCDFRDFAFPVRFLDINAPEMNAGGEITRDWLKALILDETVIILIDKKNRVDKWGRLLGHVIHNGLDLGQEEVYLGLAVPFGSETFIVLDNVPGIVVVG
jgi:endonuclease YncB( thermonuclease family)